MTSVATKLGFHLRKLHEIFLKHRAADLCNGVKNNSQDIVSCCRNDATGAFHTKYRKNKIIEML